MEHDRLFDGEIKRTAEESTVSWTPTSSELERRPNIVMIVDQETPLEELMATQ